MAGLRAIHDHVLFQFEDAAERKTSHGQTRDQFKHQTDWGFEFSDFDESLNLCRWVKVIDVGKDVTEEEIQPGARVLVEALKWTPGIEYQGEYYWRTSRDHVLAVDPTVTP